MSGLDMSPQALIARHHKRLVDSYRDYLETVDLPGEDLRHERAARVDAYSEGVEHALETVALEVRRGKS